MEIVRSSHRSHRIDGGQKQSDCHTTMSQPTAARPTSTESAHWYTVDGKPAYEFPKADGSGMTPATLRHGRKFSLLTSPTSVLKILHKEALVNYRIGEAIEAVLTTPILPGEELDAFVYRIIHRERVHEEHAKAARDRGTEFHEAIVEWFRRQTYQGHIDEVSWVNSACRHVFDLVTDPMTIKTEQILIGHGYGCKVDFIGEMQKEGGGHGPIDLIVDWKTTEKLPKESYVENRIQLAAEAKAWERLHPNRGIRTANVYISRKEQGKFVYCENPDWRKDYYGIWVPLFKVWKALNDYDPCEAQTRWETDKELDQLEKTVCL
jgi:hypothetical protein